MSQITFGFQIWRKLFHMYIRCTLCSIIHRITAADVNNFWFNCRNTYVIIFVLLYTKALVDLMNKTFHFYSQHSHLEVFVRNNYTHQVTTSNLQCSFGRSVVSTRNPLDIAHMVRIRGMSRDEVSRIWVVNYDRSIGEADWLQRSCNIDTRLEIPGAVLGGPFDVTLGCRYFVVKSTFLWCKNRVINPKGGQWAGQTKE